MLFEVFAAAQAELMRILVRHSLDNKRFIAKILIFSEVEVGGNYSVKCKKY